MQYVCRSCLLRLGQPWRTRMITATATTHPRQRRSSRLLPHSSHRANHGVASYVEGPGQEHFTRHPQQQDSSRVLTTDDNTAEADEYTKTTRRPAADESSVLVYSARRYLANAVEIRKIPKPRPKSTPSASTFTPRDSRVQFIKEHDQLEEGSWALAKVVRRFAETELFQRERLEALVRFNKSDRNKAFAAFAAWKGVMKDAHPDPSRKPKPMSAAERGCLEKFIRGHESVEDMMVARRSVPKRSNGLLSWEGDRVIISTAVRFAPDKLHMVLESMLRTYSPELRSTLNFYVVEDTLELLAQRLGRMEEDNEKQTFAQTLAHLILTTLATTRKKDDFQFSQATLYHILRNIPKNAMLSLYKRLTKLSCNLHPFTQLHVARELARTASTKSVSADIVRHNASLGLIDINSPAAASVCTSILSFTKDDLETLDEQSATPADFFRQFHSVGLIPNVLTYNTIIRSLCLKKDLKTALDVFQVMQNHGVQPDDFTWSILINGCKTCQSFELMVDFAIRACHQNIRDPVIWNDILHGAYVAVVNMPKTELRGKQRNNAIRIMNEIYSRIFDVEPVKPFVTGRHAELGQVLMHQGWIPDVLQPLPEQIPPLPPLEVLKPGSDTLSVMILGLVRCLPMPYDVVVFYSQFRDMLRQGHPAAELLVRERGTFVHDIVLRNLIKWRGTLRVALDIIRDMTRDIGKEDSSSLESSASPPATELRPHGQLEITADAGAAPPANAEGAAPDTQDASACTGSNNLDGVGQGVDESPHADPDPTFTAVGVSTPIAEVLNPEAEYPGEQSSPAQEDSTPPPRPPIRHPSPSVYTWTILMQGFMRHNQPQEAEHILELMREHSIEPNAVTWNTLATGYAKMQKIPEAVDAMRRLEAAGFRADNWTLKAFSHIGDKRRAIKLMEATVEANKLKKAASEQLQAELKEAASEQEQLNAEEVEAALTEEELQLLEARARTRAKARAQHAPEWEDQEYLDEPLDDALDWDLETRLHELDPGTVPDKVSKIISSKIRQARKLVPDQPNNFEEWARVREQGLDAVPVHDDGRRGLGDVGPARGSRNPSRR